MFHLIFERILPALKYVHSIAEKVLSSNLNQFSQNPCNPWFVRQWGLKCFFVV